MEEEIKKAIQTIKEGGIVIFPTDTAFGIGCRIDNDKAIERLFKIRRRPETQAVPALADTLDMIQEYVGPVPQEVIDKLVSPYWPGALTIILYCNRVKVPRLVRGGGSTLGVRIPNHQVARAIISGIGVPLLGPSANFHKELTPYRIEDLNPELIRLVDDIVRGETNATSDVSTVIDCTKRPWKIVRKGAIEIKL